MLLCRSHGAIIWKGTLQDTLESTIKIFISTIKMIDDEIVPPPLHLPMVYSNGPPLFSFSFCIMLLV